MNGSVVTAPVERAQGRLPSRRFVELSVRFIGMACLLVIWPSGYERGAAAPLVLGGAVLLLGLDLVKLLTIRNFFLVYTVVLFAIGVPLFMLPPQLFGDMILYVVMFLVGYTLSSLGRQDGAASGVAGAGDPDDVPLAEVNPYSIRKIEQLLLLMAFLQALLLTFNLFRSGVGTFYSGQGLVDQLNSYGRASVSGGFLQIATFFLKHTTLALMVVYVHVCLEAGKKIRYRYLLLLFLALPILSLARSDAVHGAGILVVISAVERCVRARRPPSPERGPAPERGVTPRRPVRRRVLILGGTVTVALFAALFIGGLRQSRLTESGFAQSDVAATPLQRSAPLLQSEISPIQAYSEIKENEEALGKTYGSTVVWPLLFKVVPRGLFPGKPINSGAYFMTIVHPLDFAAGFALPPTFFGDAYINFGIWGSILGCLLLGAIAARLDVAYKQARLSRLPWFLIFYANFYSLLRSPLSESLAGILLTLTAWLVLRHRLVAPATAAPHAIPGRQSLEPAR